MTIRQTPKSDFLPYWLSLVAYSFFAICILLGSENFSSGLNAILEYTFSGPLLLLIHIVHPVLWQAFRKLKVQYKTINRSPTDLIIVLFTISLFMIFFEEWFSVRSPLLKSKLSAFLNPPGESLIRDSIMFASFLLWIITVTPLSIAPQFIICRLGYALYKLYLHPSVKALFFKS